MSVTPPAPAPSRAQSWWRRYCRFTVDVFYRRFEVEGVEHLPAGGPLLVCANHANALVDAVVLQASSPRPLHPVARSGLFRNPFLRPILHFIQAVPIHRRKKDADPSATDRNDDAFDRLFAHLGEGRAILIFPEGQSHSDPSLRPIKTGAARLAIGARERHGTWPTIVPAGLTFTHKGRFRSSVLVSFGAPVTLDVDEDAQPREAVEQVTRAIASGLERVTLNVDDWEDVALMKEIQSFARFRESRDAGKPIARESLRQRYRAFRRLADTHRWLRHTRPDEVRLVREKLRRFARLRRRYGVQDYHLGLRYSPGMVARFTFWSLLYIFVVFPIALWGLVHSAIPYLITRQLSRISARGRDQYDTASMLFGLLAFGTFWGAQTAAVGYFFGWWPAAALYAASLPLTTMLALKVGYERRRIMENVRVFFLFSRKREVQEYLRLKRQEIEMDLAKLARAAKIGVVDRE